MASADLATFSQFGIVGLIAAFGIIFARTTHAREIKRGDRLEAEVTRLNAVIATMVATTTTALTTQVRAMEDSTALSRDLTPLVRDLLVDREQRHRRSP